MSYFLFFYITYVHKEVSIVWYRCNLYSISSVTYWGRWTFFVKDLCEVFICVQENHTSVSSLERISGYRPLRPTTSIRPPDHFPIFAIFSSLSTFTSSSVSSRHFLRKLGTWRENSIVHTNIPCKPYIIPPLPRNLRDLNRNGKKIVRT